MSEKISSVLGLLLLFFSLFSFHSFSKFCKRSVKFAVKMGKFGEHYNSSRTFNGIDEKFEQLNADFVTSIEEVLKKEPSAVLVPLMKDYLVRTQKTFETYNIGPKQKEGLMGFEKLGVFFQELEGDWSEMTENSVMMQVAAKAPKAKKRTHAESPDVEVSILIKRYNDNHSVYLSIINCNNIFRCTLLRRTQSLLLLLLRLFLSSRSELRSQPQLLELSLDSLSRRLQCSQ